MKHLVLIICALVCTCIGNSQTSTVKGNVADANGPLPGVSVLVKNTSIGSQTDLDGNFEIKASDGDILIFSYIGYKVTSVPITDSTKFMNVVLEADSAVLEEVVVVGYGTRKSSATLAYSVTETLAGKTSGVVTGSSMVTGRNYPYGVLTAGEINDIKEFKEWVNILKQKQYKKIQDDWGFYLEHKIEVSVRDDDKKPINNVKVVLYSNSAEKPLESMIVKTDIFGEAVLFADLNCSTIEDFYYVQIFHEGKILGKKINANTKKIAFEMNSQSESKNVDIMFTIDATGSMGDEMDYLKAELQNIMSRIDKTIGQKRVALTFYRDVGDEYTVKDLDFSSDIQKVQSFLDKQFATGGGDYEEAVEIALKTSLSNNWDHQARTRLMFFLLDAPPHWNEQNAEVIRNQIRKAQELGIKIIPIVASGADKNVEFLMRFFSVSTNGTYVFLTDDSGIGNPHLKPTKSNYQVEKLNDLIVRLVNKYAMI